MLHPAGLGKYLFVLHLIQADDMALVVENNKTVAGGAEIDRADVLAHPGPPVLPLQVLHPNAVTITSAIAYGGRSRIIGA